MATKSLPSGVEIKSASKGEVEAVFSTFNVVDHDNDVTFPGAFEDGAEVIISGYKHSVWSGSLPVGKGRIRTTKSEAILQGQFFLDTTQGRDTFEVVKQLGARQEWSYGYDVLNPPETGMFDGRKANFLRRLKVHEVSPVFQGAGINTRTLAVKSLTDAGMDLRDAERLVERTVNVSQYKAAIKPHDAPTSTKAWDAAKLDIDDNASIPDLRAIHAWCDPNGDPELKSSYRFPHHYGPGEEASVHACLVGIAKLNGASPGIPEEDRRGVYNHLAAHVQDADIDPPELRPENADLAELKLNDRLITHLAVQDELLKEVAEVSASRALKGKSIGSLTHYILGWMNDSHRAIRAAYDSPQDDAAREYVRYVQSLRTGENE